jgi:hypothetical protein
LGSQLDVGIGEGFSHYIDLLDGVIDTASEDRFAKSDHSVHLITMTDASNAITLSSGHVPAGNVTVVRTSEYSVTILVHCHDSYRFVVALKVKWFRIIAFN